MIFFLYGADKRKAIERKRRISERTLFMTAFFMGGVGAVFGMLFFRHKTKHWEFRLLLPLFAALNIAAVYYFITRFALE
jgi:uncharacterized membrane protein YsdA (DUF1294 family)